MVSPIFAFGGFFVILTVILFGGNYFVFKTFYNIFNLQANTTFYILVIASSILFIVASVLERMNTEPTRILYVISAAWIGILFIAFMLTLLVRIIGIFTPIQGNTIGLTLIGLTIIISAYAIYHSSDTKIHETDLTTSKFKENLKIIQLSDLHLGAVRSTNFARKVVDLTNSVNPDLVLIAGDLFDGTGIYDENILAPFNDLKSDIYMILGNHDFYTGIDKVIKYVNTSKIHLIRNDKINWKNIQIIGIDDANDKQQAPNELKNINFDKNKYSILLYHRPDGFNEISNQGIDLMLSGHTHAGQIFPFGLIEKLFIFPQLNGVFTQNTSKLIVLEGVGTWGPPMRLGTDSEIMVIKIN